MRLAEKAWGSGSPEFLEARRRHLESQGRELEIRARDRVQARDWPAAAEAYGRLVVEARSPRMGEYRAALTLSSDFARAEELEKKRRFDEAIEIYRPYASMDLPCKAYVGECLERLRRLREAPARSP